MLTNETRGAKLVNDDKQLGRKLLPSALLFHSLNILPAVPPLMSSCPSSSLHGTLQPDGKTKRLREQPHSYNLRAIMAVILPVSSYHSSKYGGLEF